MTPRTRVLTDFGFGSHAAGDASPMVTVALEQPFLGKTEMPFDRARHVFAFSEHALVRVLNVDGVGFISNMQFYPGCWGGIERQMRAPCPPDETRVLLHLDTGKIEVNHDQLSPDMPFLRMNPWIDRHGREQTVQFDDEDAAVAEFDNDMALLGGAAGISSHLLINVEKRELLRLCIAIAPPQGIIYRWPPPK